MSHREYLEGDYRYKLWERQIFIAQKPRALSV